MLPVFGRYFVLNIKRWKWGRDGPLCEMRVFSQYFTMFSEPLLPFHATSPEATAGRAGSRTTSPIMPARGSEPPPFRHRCSGAVGLDWVGAAPRSPVPAVAMSRLSGAWDGTGEEVQLLLDL